MTKEMNRRLGRMLVGFAVLLGSISFAPGTTAQIGGGSFVIRSPYRSLQQTQAFVNSAAMRVLLQHDYVERGAGDGQWKTAKLTGVRSARYFVRPLGAGRERTVELAVVPYPTGGFELHVYGSERAADGVGPNSDLNDLRSSFDELATDLETERDDPSNRRLESEMYSLSYVNADRATGVLKSLGYSVVEFNAVEGDNAYEKNFEPTRVVDEGTRLPVVVKLIDSGKTSLMDPSLMEMQGIEATANPEASRTLPDLGGLYLHGMTSGEPPQRLLLVYDANDTEPIERLMNLLRDKIDVPARQILIEALVIELNAEKLNDFGVSWGASGISGSNSSNSQNRFDTFLGESAATRGDGFNPFNFVFERNAIADLFKFRVQLKALVDRGDAEILSNPSVLVLDGRQARIQIGQNIPVVETTLTNQATSENVSYFPVGIVLNLRPRVADDGAEVVMQVETIVSSVALTVQSGEVAVAPVVDNRQVQTFVRVSDNTPFIIGGLISTERQISHEGVPLLSQIPILGSLFSRTVDQRNKKEVIVVLTPHVIPHRAKNFSYVIPQEVEIFDSFGKELFRNAYRIREQDVYDLAFLQQSDFFRGLRERVERAVDGNPALRDHEGVAKVLAGGVPGEEVLIRRMIYEIVSRSGFVSNLPTEKVIFFEDYPEAADGTGFRLNFLSKILQERTREQNAVLLTYDQKLAGTPEHPFVQPRAYVDVESLSKDGYTGALVRSNRRKADGEPDQWTAVVTDDNLVRLKNILIMKRVLALNPSLPLTLEGFYNGREIVFPTERDISERFHLLDPEAARFFYEMELYYPAFEQEFMYQTRLIDAAIRGSK